MQREVITFAPGRVNLIGEHTDYNQGLALPFAIDRGVTVRAAARADRQVHAAACDLGEIDTFAVDAIAPASGWRGFVRGAVAELGRRGVRVAGMQLDITGTVPQGVGLASSGALAVALAMAVIALADGAGPSGIELARCCSRIENQWVGAHGGLLDQLASIFGQADHALRIDFLSLNVRPVPLELRGWRLVTLDSGERRTNAESGYNLRRAECARARELLGIDSLRHATEAAARRLPDPLDRRVLHVLGANRRVDAALKALARGELAELGGLLNESHASLRDLYEVSTPAVEETVGRLKAAGASGARLMGGGFGGVVLGLLAPGLAVPDGAVEMRPGRGARVQPGG